MKGPYERLKFDLRRLWECPVCKRRERTAGTVTFRHCACQMQKLEGKPVVMKLVADGAQRMVPAIKGAISEVVTHSPDATHLPDDAEAVASNFSSATTSEPTEPKSSSD